IFMPGMDGWAVLETLKADPDLKNIPVIVLSMAEHGNLAKDLGAFAALSKPVSRRTLVSAVQSAYLHWRDAGQTPSPEKPPVLQEV
ncbi:MAG: response regulator, partial [Chloroflexi bacterium]|nr:response regulator [Chloroflexota bacterium]